MDRERLRCGAFTISSWGFSVCRFFLGCFGQARAGEPGQLDKRAIG